MQTNTQEGLSEIIIDKEFKDLLPPLDGETYKSLEENIIANGCMFPLITWNGILIDGHNRYAICTEHEIEYKTVEKEFPSREDVVIWIVGNQVARRNLTPMQLAYFRGLHYNTVKLKRGNRLGRNQYSEEKGNNYTFPQEPVTADDLSKEYKVSRKTIFADSKTTKAIDAIGKISPEAKAKILSGDVQIDKKDLKRLVSASDDELGEIAAEIEGGTYAKRKPENTDSDGLPTKIAAASSIIAETAEAAYRAFAKTAENGTKAQIRKALRTLIDSLEKLHAQV